LATKQPPNNNGQG